MSVVVALFLAGTVAYLVVRPRATQGGGSTDVPLPPDITDILDEGDSGRNLAIQVQDKENPDRLAAELLAARYDPDGPSHRKVEQPRAWLFGEDGSTWYIEADKGRFYIPEGNDQPRSGSLTGHVRARRFGPDAAGRPDPETAMPTVTATTDAPLHFDLDVYSFETEGRLHVESDELDFVGRGVFAVLNEQRESLSRLRVDHGEKLTYTPGDEPAAPPISSVDRVGPTTVLTAFTPAGSTAAQAETPASPEQVEPQSAAQPPAMPGAPKIDLYQTRFNDHVVVTHGSEVIKSDLLTVWTRLIDNKIPDRSRPQSARGPMPAMLSDLLPSLAAATPDPIGAAPPAGTPDSDAVLSPEPAPGVDPAAPNQTHPPAAEPVVLTWDGPMEVVPLQNEPSELTMGDDVALRFDVTEGHVEFEDTTTHAAGRAQTASYFEGRERVELIGPAGSVELESPESGRISGANSMYIELGAGVVMIPTAGELTGAQHDDTPGAESPQRIRWRSSAMFSFALKDGRMTDRIERARFEGGVEGASRDSTLNGERIDAIFDSEEGGDPRLVQLNAEKARGDDGRGGTLAGDGLEVHFAPGSRGDDLDPTRVIITGSALARREGGESIRADRIDASLTRKDDGDITVTQADAEGSVVFNDGRGAEGRGDHLEADALAENAVITGEGSRVSSGTASITGAHIELDNAKRTVLVEGPGTFSQADSDGKSIEATWDEKMFFDDLAGRLDCVGQTTAESIDADGTRDHVEAHRLEITLDPYSNNGHDLNQRLRSAIAFGNGDAMASIESRRVAVGTLPEEPRVDEIFHLEGGEIRFAARDDRLDVPGPGKLFVLDRRPDADNAGNDGNAIIGAGGRRGTTLFTWTGSLGFDRRAGEAVFADGVRVAHKPLTQAAITELTADSLVARFTKEEGSSLAEGGEFDGALRFAEARGGALLHVDRRREIAADHLIYDAIRGVVQAESGPSGHVEVTDLLRGTTSHPRAILWDMREDRIELTEPGSVVAPE